MSNLQSAKTYANKSLDIIRPLDHGDHGVLRQHGVCQFTLSELRLLLGRTSEEILGMEAALACFSGVHEDCANETHTTLACLVSAYQHSGQLELALASLIKAEAFLLSHKSEMSKSEARSAELLRKKASLLFDMGRMEESFELFKTSLAHLESIHGKQNEQIADLLAAWGSRQLRAGQLTEAKATIRREMAIRDKLGLEVTVPHGYSIANLALTLASIGGRDTAARDLFTHGLRLLRKLLPPDHGKIAQVLNAIADLKRRMGDESAITTAEEARAVERRSQTNCAGPGCTRRVRPDDAPLDQCAGCLRTYYCGKACQTADWKAGHKAECKALVAEGATGAER